MRGRQEILESHSCLLIMEIHFILGHSVLICSDRRYPLPKNKCCSLTLVFERDLVRSMCASVRVNADTVKAPDFAGVHT